MPQTLDRCPATLLTSFSLWATLLIVTTLLICPGLAVGDASTPTAASSPFGETISIVEMQLPVQVLVRGEPLAGLTAADFELFVDGQAHELLAVQEIAYAATGKSFETMPTHPSASGTASAGSRVFAVLFDLASGRRGDLLRAVVGVREMVERQLAPGDRVALATYSGGRQVTLVTRLTDDPNELLLGLALILGTVSGDTPGVERAHQALEELRSGASPLEKLSGGMGWSTGLALAGGALPFAEAASPGSTGWGLGPGGLGRVSRNGPLAASGGIASTLASSAEELQADLAAGAAFSAMRNFSLAMADFVTLLRDAPGSDRQVLLFSSGFGLHPKRKDITARLSQAHRVRRAFLRSGWTLHSFGFGGGNDGLFFLSNETGGELHSNSVRFHEATAKLLARQRLTYVLSFQVEDLRTDGFGRKLEVRLRDAPKKTKVIHRPSFYAPKPFAKRSPLERRLDAANLVLSDVELAELEVAAQVRSRQGSSQLEVEISKRHLASSTEGAELVTVELQAYVLDEWGTVLDVIQRRVELELATLVDAGDSLRIHADLEDLGLGAQRVRLLVQQLHGGRFFLGSVPIPDVTKAPQSFAP